MQVQIEFHRNLGEFNHCRLFLGLLMYPTQNWLWCWSRIKLNPLFFIILPTNQEKNTKHENRNIINYRSYKNHIIHLPMQASFHTIKWRVYSSCDGDVVDPTFNMSLVKMLIHDHSQFHSINISSSILKYFLHALTCVYKNVTYH
jgi:hypothetical protein